MFVGGVVDVGIFIPNHNPLMGQNTHCLGLMRECSHAYSLSALNRLVTRVLAPISITPIGASANRGGVVMGNVLRLSQTPGGRSSSG